MGGWPVVSLADAREKALTNMRAAKTAGDPLAAKRRANLPTVAEAASLVIDLHRSTWTSPKTPYQWEQTFATYVNPAIGSTKSWPAAGQ